MRLSEATAMFLRSKKEATRRLYKYVLASLLAFLGDILLEEITADALQQWENGLELIKSCSTRNKGQTLSEYTMHRMVRQVRHFFNWLVKHEFISQSPAKWLELPELPEGKPPKAIADDDLRQLIAVARREKRWRDYAILRFFADTGCRLSGLLNLKPKDLDLKRRRAWVTEKRKRTRLVAFGKQTEAALRLWLRMRHMYEKGGCLRNPNCQRDYDKLFLGQRGNLTPSGIHRMIEELATLADVTDPHNAHSFRHALARRMLEHGADLGTVSRYLGHNTLETTHKFYTCWTQEELMGRHGRFGGILDE